MTTTFDNDREPGCCCAGCLEPPPPAPRIVEAPPRCACCRRAHRARLGYAMGYTNEELCPRCEREHTNEAEEAA
jgi:hypothetical protein